VFQEPLVSIGGEPSAQENADLATALLGYAKRSGPDDFASLTGFLEKYPNSSWRAALLTSLGLDYYNTAYYSRALAAWQEAWALGQAATNVNGKFLADRAVCELAGLYSRLGRMNELEALLKSVDKRTFIGGASERINIAWEALSMMQNQPGVSFRCGPLALKSILRADQRLLASCSTNAMMEIFNSASTQKGLSLTQVAELSRKVALNYQMAFRGEAVGTRSTASPNGPNSRTRWDASLPFIVPSVVHWKVGHYAAIVRQDGDRYLVEDLTFLNSVWATKEALEAEASGYFLIPAGDLPRGWRSVDAKEGDAIWGKGVTGGSDPNQYTCRNEQTTSCTGSGCGMPVCSVHLMLANLQVRDTPVGYTPPVGPGVHFTVRYNQRDYLQTAGFASKLLGPKWTHDWNGYLQVGGAEATYVVEGGGARIFRQFDPVTQTYAPNQYDQSVLRRSGQGRYVITWPDGSTRIFSRSGSSGTLLTQVADPAGNAVTLTYDGDRLVALTDAIGQVTTISYEHASNPDLITKVTDPFGRFATFEYASLDISLGQPNGTCTNVPAYTPIDFLVKITDVLGLQSQFAYEVIDSAPTNHSCVLTNPPVPIFSDNLKSLTTPYGTTSFLISGGPSTNSNFRFVTITYPDGSHERVEYNQAQGLGIPASEPPALVPAGISTFNNFNYGRNTYHWSRAAMASGGGSHTQAKVYHWLHTEDQALTAGVLESVKEPLENRVWFNYPGQEFPIEIGASSRPTRVGRVLEDGQTQLYSYGYNAFGLLTNSIDPIGRTFSYLYGTNGIDLLEIRQTRAGNNELLARITYNSQHEPLSVVDAAGQTNTFTYNDRGQQLTITNPKGDTTTYSYDPDGYLLTADGQQPGTNDLLKATYDFFGHVRTLTDVSGYTITFDYDAMDRITKITHSDSTFEQFIYDRLDLAEFRDRAGRHSFYEIDNMRQVKKKTDPLNRVTRFEWCRCGKVQSLTDPLGRTTSWLTDVQGRVTSKKYGDGTQVSYVYEIGSSRPKFFIDEKQQITQFAWNRDDTLASVVYGNSAIPTPGASFLYDRNYQRIVSMMDGSGSTLYSYNPILATPALGAGALASVDGPLPNDTITFTYDERGRPARRSINGAGTALSYDTAGRVLAETNALGTFAFAYDGSSRRLASVSFPNSQVHERSYGNVGQDFLLRRITHRIGANPVSDFVYGHNVPAGQVTTWSQTSGTQPSAIHNFAYDDANQLLSVTVTNSGSLNGTFAYAYDLAGNRLTEQVGASNYTAAYNALNQLHTSSGPGGTRTNEWDAQNRLVTVSFENQRTEFTYDGFGRRVAIRHLVNGSEVSFRRFVWSDGEICEERDAAGAVTKRFFPQGMRVETGPNAGAYFYTRDHLGSIRELIDSGGNVVARYAYDPYGRRSKLEGDLESDFGFATMFWCAEANLFLTQFRAYDAGLGRWLSRDPLPEAELAQGPNLYAYVGNDAVSLTDPKGLCTGSTLCKCFNNPANFATCNAAGIVGKEGLEKGAPLVRNAPALSQAAQCAQANANTIAGLDETLPGVVPRLHMLLEEGAPVVNTLRGIGPVGPNAAFRAQVAANRAAASVESAAEFLAGKSPAYQWWWQTIQATREYRESLGSVQAMFEHSQSIDELAELLFGKFF
jgi:RHS repeat-associated protein